MLRLSALSSAVASWFLLLSVAGQGYAQQRHDDHRVSPPTERSAPAPLVVDDFEKYEVGSMPNEWKYIRRDRTVLPLSEVSDETEHVYVREEGGNKFARAFTENESLRITKRNGVDFEWDLKERPYLSWEWRARQLPEGASENDDNDAGGAVYVTFGSDWIGRPISIKYTYSSTLPVGTVVKQGALRVLVVASGRDKGTGRWKTELRDVAADYRQVFGDDPPEEPVSITLWSDSDTVRDRSEMDFDDIELLSRP